MTESTEVSGLTAGLEPEAPRAHSRHAAVALLVAALAVLYVVVRGDTDPTVSDFDQLWHGARAIMMGKNPYEYVGPDGVFVWDHLFYPLPAILLVTPLALLPLLAARAGMAAISAGLLAWVFVRRSPWSLLLLLSGPFLLAIGRGQFSPLLVVAAYLPMLMWLGVAKPNIAIPMWLGSRNPRLGFIAGAIGGLVLVVVSFIVFPGWFSSWLDMLALKNNTTSLPILGQGGFLILLALLRWRRAESRLVFGLGVLPQTPSVYDTVPLFLVPIGFRENCILAITGNLALLLLVAGPGMTTAELGPTYFDRAMLWSSLCMYLPCVVMILRRPNTSATVERGTFNGRPVDVALLVTLAVSTFFAGWASLGRYL